MSVYGVIYRRVHGSCHNVPVLHNSYEVQPHADRRSSPAVQNITRDTELRAHNMQPTHTIANILMATELSPRNQRQFGLSYSRRDKTIRLNAYLCLLSTCSWLEFLLHSCDHVKKMQVFVLQVSDIFAPGRRRRPRRMVHVFRYRMCRCILYFMVGRGP